MFEKTLLTWCPMMLSRTTPAMTMKMNAITKTMTRPMQPMLPPMAIFAPVPIPWVGCCMGA